MRKSNLLHPAAAGAAVFLVGHNLGDGGKAHQEIDHRLNSRPGAENRIDHVVSERGQSPVQSSDNQEDEGHDMKSFHVKIKENL